jgi:serine/threonine protein kinase/Tfp pilus assembly protein PilF
MVIKCPKCQHENPETARSCIECGLQLDMIDEIPHFHTETLETPKEELTTGSTFANRYQIIEEIGKGGMGRVYKVQDTKIKEKIALKLIKPEIAKDKRTIERFSNELRLARKIRHKNVCQMFDLGEERGTQFITMEYVSGEDLRNSIRRFGQLPIGKSIAIVKQICEGLAEAHRQGVVHRDLKSNNIMIDDDGNVRIMDFGIARSLEAKGITGAGVMIGTPEYMSPEQVEGKELDQRSDIYSLGVILYEMVTGRVPFEGDTPFTVGVKQKSEAPPNPKDINSQIPDDLNKVILRCLEKDKEKRYQDVGEVRSELSNIEKGIPTTERIIPDKKPLTSREITVTFGMKKLLIPLMIIAAVVIIGLIIWQVLPKKEAIPTAETENPSVAVMYFENNTGDPGMDHYRKSISDLLITDLSQSKYLDVLSGAKLFNILSKMGQLEEKTYSSEAIEEIANRGRVKHVIVGSFSRAGDVYRLNYSILDAATSDIVGSDTVQGQGEESFWTMVDEITRKIKANLNLSEEMLADDFDRDIGEITTSSPEAYKYYSEGARFDHLGQYEKSLELMERAIDIDPEFAMAYRSMGITYGDQQYYSKSKEYLRKAFELSNRVSTRERYQIQGDFYSYTEEYEKAIEAYKQLLELYPKDTDANINLGVIYAGLEEWDKAIERFEVLRHTGDESIFSYMNLALIFMSKESYEEAEEIINDYFRNFAENASLYYMLARNFVYQGKLDLALTEIDKASALEPDNYYRHLGRGNIFLFKGDLAEAEKEYQKLLNMDEPRAHFEGLRGLANLSLVKGKFNKAKDYAKQCILWADDIEEMRSKTWSQAYLAYIHSASGNQEQALSELDESWKTAVASDLAYYQMYNYWRQGKVFAKMGSLDKAQEAAEEFKTRIELGMDKYAIRDYYVLMGLIELKKGNLSKSIENLTKALPMYPYGPLDKPAHSHETLALASYRSGNLKKAQEEFTKITKLTSGRQYFGDIYAKAFYMLGKIYEELGDKARAIENYEKFLELWKDADTGLSEVADARKRLAGLNTP